MNDRSKRRLRIGVLVGVVGVGGAALAAESLFVQRDSADVMEGAGPLYDIVESVPKNTKLQVIERNDDGWDKVKTPSGKEGYVLAEALAAQQLGLGNLNPNAQAKANLSLASKGLEPEAEEYSRQKNYNTTSLNHLRDLDRRSSKNAREWEQFCKEGQVGHYKSKSQ